MLILAIEQSSDKAGVALLEDEKLVAENSWDARSLQRGLLFSALKTLLAKAAADLKDVSCYAVDIGPGSYSGLRSAFAAASAFALPGKQTIYALKSCEAIAFEIFHKYSADKVQVVGDARRQQLWHCVYANHAGLPVAQTELTLTPEKDFLPLPGALLVSPDWTRLEGKLKSSLSGNVRLIEAPCVPGAAQLGRLAYRRMCLNVPGEPLKIIYLHTAVNINPNPEH